MDGGLKATASSSSAQVPATLGRDVEGHNFSPSRLDLSDLDSQRSQRSLEDQF